MSNAHLTCFINHKRPSLRNPLVDDLPRAALNDDLMSKLEDSLKVSQSNPVACAMSGRLCESIVETHRVPFLLLRVADMRMALGSDATALLLYEEVQDILNDPQLGKWLERYRSSLQWPTIQKQFSITSHNRKTQFTPSQRWRPTARQDSFPHCRLQQAQLKHLSDLWSTMNEAVRSRYFNFHCLETNSIEGRLKLNPSLITRLIQEGFNDQVQLTSEEVIKEGAVHHPADALAILRDTRQALDESINLSNSDTPNLSVETTCRLHKTLLKTSQVLYTHSASGFVPSQLSYTNIGLTRQTSLINATARVELQGQHIKVQFCPYDQVDAELGAFNERLTDLIQQSETMDPFAAAAWIQHVFGTIQPFEDGNGPLSRILASIPLLRCGLPPLCIPTSDKENYLILLNSVRANRDGDYRPLMQFLYEATRASLESLQRRR